VRQGARGERIVKSVLEAALNELERSGYAGFTMDAVVREAGVSRTTVYRRWPTKIALITAVVESLQAHLQPPPTTTSLRVDLIGLGRALGENLASVGDRALARALNGDSGFPELRQVARVSGPVAMRPFLDAFSRGQGRGEVGVDDDIDLLTHLFFNGIVSIALNHEREPTIVEITAIADVIMRSLQPPTFTSTTTTTAATKRKKPTTKKSTAKKR